MHPSLKVKGRPGQVAGQSRQVEVADVAFTDPTGVTVQGLHSTPCKKDDEETGLGKEVSKKCEVMREKKTPLLGTSPNTPSQGSAPGNVGWRNWAERGVARKVPSPPPTRRKSMEGRSHSGA